VGAVLPGVALAQGAPVQPVEGGFSAERYTAAVDPAGLLGVEWGAVPEQHWGAGAWAGYARAPLQIVRYQDGVEVARGTLVENRVGGALFGFYRLTPRLLVAAELGLVGWQNRAASALTASGFATEAPGGTGLSNLRLTGKYALLSQASHGVDLSGQLGVSLPTGTPGTYAGDEAVMLEPVVAVSRTFGNLRATANLGYRWRTTEPSTTLRMGSELLYRVAAAYPVAQLEGRPLSVAVGFSGATAALTPASQGNGGTDSPQSPGEALAGLVYGTRNLQLALTGGVGVTKGYGNPAFRGLLEVRFIPDVPVDAPAPAPAPAPNPDADNDGVTGEADLCPNEPETLNGFQDSDGCPDLVAAQAPATESDSDGDGVVDSQDAAPNAAEDKDGFQDGDGVPDPDNDSDGLADTADSCPNEAEIQNGFQDTDGCPDQAPAPVIQKIELKGEVRFDSSAATLKPESDAVLMEVVRVMTEHPELKKVRVEGHTDASGNRQRNISLSRSRAAAVVKWLVAHGISASRLVSEGFGPDKPIASNDTQEGKALNRRTEFIVVP
jgi:outer membrane protein OmpA-like peptidoglycan-associated protein